MWFSDLSGMSKERQEITAGNIMTVEQLNLRNHPVTGMLVKPGPLIWKDDSTDCGCDCDCLLLACRRTVRSS